MTHSKMTVQLIETIYGNIWHKDRDSIHFNSK